MKKQEIKVYTVLLIDHESTVALQSFTDRKEANTFALNSMRAWGSDGEIMRTYGVNKQGLATATYQEGNHPVITYKVVKTQLFI